VTTLANERRKMATLTAKLESRIARNASDLGEFAGDARPANASSLVNHVDRDLIYGDITERHLRRAPFQP
jgi:hypothetical protein